MRSEATTAVKQPTVFVIATRFEGTRTALEAAIPLARGSRARLIVLVPLIVPYPLPLDEPADSSSFAAERHRKLLHDLNGDAEVRLCLCRRADDVIWQMLPLRSTVVVGGPAGTWRASRDERLARRLTRLGHRVVFAQIDERPVEGGAEQLGSVHREIFDVRSMDIS